MRIGIILEGHPQGRMSPLTRDVVRLLSERGVTVDLIHPGDRVFDLSGVKVDHDLYVLKSKTDLTLSLAGALHGVGATILNPYPTSMMMRDKIVTTRILQLAGVPVPVTYVTSHQETLAPLLDTGPLVIKPYRGSRGRGIRVVRDPGELMKVRSDRGIVFAQRYHEPKGPDLKIYSIGDELFGVKRPWPARTYQDKLGEPFSITPELRDIALKCGEAFGIRVYGIDVILTEGGPYVVDASSFPGFKGVPDAAIRLADYVYAAAGGRSGEEPAISAAMCPEMVP